MASKQAGPFPSLEVIERASNEDALWLFEAAAGDLVRRFQTYHGMFTVMSARPRKGVDVG